MGQQLVDLGGDNLVGLAIVAAALGVAHDAVVELHAFEHFGADFAGVGALLLVADVLGTHQEIAVVGVVGGHLEIGERGADDKQSFARKLGLLEFLHDSVDEFIGLGEGAVHLPVACYNMFSHF